MLPTLAPRTAGGAATAPLGSPRARSLGPAPPRARALGRRHPRALPRRRPGRLAARAGARRLARAGRAVRRRPARLPGPPARPRAAGGARRAGRRRGGAGRGAGLVRRPRRRRGLDLDVAPLPATRAYAALLQRLDAAPYADAVAALWLVERVYLDAWTSALPGAEPFRELVEHWTVPGFAAYVAGLEALAVAPADDALLREVLRAEAAFWPAVEVAREPVRAGSGPPPPTRRTPPCSTRSSAGSPTAPCPARPSRATSRRTRSSSSASPAPTPSRSRAAPTGRPRGLRRPARGGARRAAAARRLRPRVGRRPTGVRRCRRRRPTPTSCSPPRRCPGRGWCAPP